MWLLDKAATTNDTRWLCRNVIFGVAKKMMWDRLEEISTVKDDVTEG